MNLYRKISDLELVIESVELREKEKEVSEDFTRKTTTVVLKGKGSNGKGEDVIYEPEKHRYPRLDIAGNYSFDSFSSKLDQLQLFPEDVDHDSTDENYRRWALESAALDLALKQADTNLAKVLDRKYHALNFVVSPSMDSPNIERLREFIEVNLSVNFKLDASTEWNSKFIEKLEEMQRVKVVDLKGHYEKEDVGMEPEPEIYSMIVEGLPEALLEDPKMTRETGRILSGHEDRITWDKPITGVKSVENLPFQPEILNIKPSRFGTAKSLLETIEYCMENSIEMYGGGQFELGMGRQHIHAFASIFYPDSPNDVAPKIYNQQKLPKNPPKSPLKPEKDLEGLEWHFNS